MQLEKTSTICYVIRISYYDTKKLKTCLKNVDGHMHIIIMTIRFITINKQTCMLVSLVREQGDIFGYSPISVTELPTSIQDSGIP